MKTFTRLATHPFQVATCNIIRDWYNSGTGTRLQIASPTGTGKSYMELDILREFLPHSWLITPKVEIINDMMAKLGHKFKNQDLTIQYAFQEYHITTPIVFRNRLMSGKWEAEPDLLIKDESHHDEAMTWEQLDTLMPSRCRFLGFSASPYRGTNKETVDYYAKWGPPTWAITYSDALAEGYISMPNCSTRALVDDDLIEVSSGKFNIVQVARAVENSLEDALLHVKHWFNDDGTPKRATLISMPTSEIIPQIEYYAGKYGYKLAFITQATKYQDRQRIFELCKNAKVALCHINVVSEGVDLPIRNHLDLTPRYSPNSFMQVFGRTTRPLRPGEIPGEYICTNRNLERHGYLLNGAIPASVIREAQQAFKEPSNRVKTRVTGLQSIGKFKSNQVTLTSGMKVETFAISQMEGAVKQQYYVILHPCFEDAFWFKKVSTKVNEKDYDWGKWEPLFNPPCNLQGFKSEARGTVSPSQKKMWDKYAEKHGILKEQKYDKHSFQIVPVLLDSQVILTEEI